MGEGEEDVNPPPWWSDPWWRWFLTIVLASVAASIVTGGLFFVLNWRLTSGARRAAERAQRIGEVVDAYLRYVEAGRYAGIHALFIAGVKRLRDDEEIQQALDRIAAQKGERPLSDVDPGKLKAFCDEISVQGPSIVGHGEAIAKYRKKS